MTPVEIAWLAGLFEGEGCIAWNGPNGVTLMLSMTDGDVVRRIREVTGVGTVIGPIEKGGVRKPVWYWSAGKKGEVLRLLIAMAPLLGERRRERALEAADRLSRNSGAAGAPGRPRPWKRKAALVGGQ